MELTGKKIFGITGDIASGKTFTCNKLVKIATKKKIKLQILSVDDIRRNILSKSKKQKHIDLRKLLIKKLKLKKIDKKYAFINLLEISNRIFGNVNNMKFFRSQVNKEIYLIIKNHILKTKDIIILEWAFLIEDGFINLTNGNVIFIKCHKRQRLKRLKNTDLPRSNLRKRLQVQRNFKKTKNEIIKFQKKTGKGALIIFDSTKNPDNNKYTQLFNKIINTFDNKIHKI